MASAAKVPFAAWATAARDAFATVSAAKGTLATLGRFAGEVRP